MSKEALSVEDTLKLALDALDYASYNTEPEGDLNCNCLICQATVAVKAALAQPEQCTGCEGKPSNVNNPCTVCGKSQPEQEPVAWIDASSFAMMNQDSRFNRVQWQTTLTLSQVYEGQIPFYITPPQPQSEARGLSQSKPLTDEEIERLIFRSGGHKSTQNLMSNPMQVREYVELWNERIYKFARAIEAAHGIKE